MTFAQESTVHVHDEAIMAQDMGMENDPLCYDEDENPIPSSVFDSGSSLVPPASVWTEETTETTEEDDSQSSAEEEGPGTRCNRKVPSSSLKEGRESYAHPIFRYRGSCGNSKEEEEDTVYGDVRERMEELARKDRDLQFQFDNNHINDRSDEASQHVPFFVAFTTYLGYAVLILTGHFRDFLARVTGKGRYLTKPKHKSTEEAKKYAPLTNSWENFYTRRLYHRIQDCFNRPLSSSPGATIDVMERTSTDGNVTLEIPEECHPEWYQDGPHCILPPSSLSSSTDNEDDSSRILPPAVNRRCTNLGSYNYLGFGDDWARTCADDVLPTLRNFPVSCGAGRMEGAGTTVEHRALERSVASFLQTEDCLVHNMGFNTNATTIGALVGSGDLIVSDELNHTSLVVGARASAAGIRVFRHNSAVHLEEILREAIAMGRPRTRRPFRRILVLVEGIYSMEGEYCALGPIYRVCRRYGATLYLDEAHSIGAMGPTGRGCSEYWGITDRTDDYGNDSLVLMGTFSKSFGGMGGYVAGSKHLIDGLRSKCAGSIYHNSLSPIVCRQITCALKIISGEDGTDLGQRKLEALRDNSNYFRMRLIDMGLYVLGNYDSPVIPIMLYNPTKIAAFSRECFKRGLAVVVVGFPAVPLLLGRARFCVSAAHTRADLDRTLHELEEIADLLKLRYRRRAMG